MLPAPRGGAAVAEGGVEYARAVLERSLGAGRANELIGRLSATIERRPFEFLRRSSPEQIFAFLRNEAPQTIAVVLANLHTALAAEVLAQLPAEQQAEVALRVGTMTEISPDVTRDVEAVLRQKLSNVVTQEYSSAGGVKSLAEILNHSDRTTERNVLDSLAERYAELADEVRMLLFTFEDIVKLDDRSIQLVLKGVDAKDLGLALRGVNEETKNRIFANMSERGAEVPDVGDLLAVVESARAEADAIREAARAEGFAAGQAEGAAAARALAQAQLAPAVQALQAAAEALAAERAALADQVEARAVDLALELAEKVVAGAIE